MARVSVVRSPLATIRVLTRGGGKPGWFGGCRAKGSPTCPVGYGAPPSAAVDVATTT